MSAHLLSMKISEDWIIFINHLKDLETNVYFKALLGTFRIFKVAIHR